MYSNVCGLLVALTLWVSAVMKLNGKKKFEESLEEFGVPDALRERTAQVVIAVEAIVGTLLIPNATRRIAGLAAATLLAAFSSVAGIAIKRGKRPTCNCFGSLSNEPLSWTLFARNGVLNSRVTCDGQGSVFSSIEDALGWTDSNGRSHYFDWGCDWESGTRLGTLETIRNDPQIIGG